MQPNPTLAETLNYALIWIAGVGLLALLAGCASADQRLHDKANYRQAQVSIVAAQEKARTERETAEAVETAAMWAALAEIVKADPDSSGMVAMVAAVSAARDGQAPSRSASMVTLKTEQDVTALDWVKVLANPVTNVGIAALNMDLQKTIAKQRTLVDLADMQMQGKLYDSFVELGSKETTQYNVSDEAYVDLSSTVTTTTSGDTTSGDTISDSYNVTETATDSYNVTETTSGDTITDSNNTTDSSDNSDNSVTDTVEEPIAP
jgi:hypothetical protein